MDLRASPLSEGPLVRQECFSARFVRDKEGRMVTMSLSTPGNNWYTIYDDEKGQAQLNGH